MSRVSTPFLIVVALGAFLGSYNVIYSSVKGSERGHYHMPAVMTGEKSNGYSSVEAHSLSEENRELIHPVMRRPFQKARQRKLRKFHTAVTCSEGVYNRWQVRIMYYWYKKFQAVPGGEEMGSFTRILHSGVPDNIMDEVPTTVVDPLPPGLDKGYVVLNRPWAFVQWLASADFREEYVFMAEPDHIIVRPIPNIASEHMPVAFPFFYITPREYEGVLRKFYPVARGPISSIDPIGNSPVIIRTEDLKMIAPTWNNVSLAMKEDAEADKAFGWVLEMYGYAVAAALHGIQHILRKEWMIQPPWDLEIADKYMIHYTYGCDYNLKGELTYGKIGEWRFDKRSFSSGYPPRNLMMPPAGVPESVVKLVTMVNEATANIPNWKAEDG